MQVAGADTKGKGSYVLVSKPIEQVKAGERVASRDEKTGKSSFKRVLQTTVRNVDVTVEVTLADAKSGKVVEVLTTTRNHPFYVREKGFVPVGGLAVGNAIVTRAGPEVVVKSLKWLRRTEGYTVYNFEVEEDHTYFVGTANGGVWVHNPSCIVNDIILETNAAVNEITSAYTPTVDEALETLETFLGPGYREIGKPNSGVFLSADGLRRARIDNNSLLGRHRPFVPHVHLETFAPSGAPIANNHIPFR